MRNINFDFLPVPTMIEMSLLPKFQLGDLHAILKIQDLTQQTYRCPEGKLPKLHLFLEHRLDLNENKSFNHKMVCHL